MFISYVILIEYVPCFLYVDLIKECIIGMILNVDVILEYTFDLMFRCHI